MGMLTRESVASAISMNDEVRRALAGTGTAYRADEVAAAAIRYPLGLAGALRKCASQELAATSYFRGPRTRSHAGYGSTSGATDRSRI